MRSFDESGVVENIRAAGGEIFAITSEPSALAAEAHTAWELNFETVGDPHHEILATCRDRGWLDLFVVEQARAELQQKWASHPNGHFQPGVVALTADHRVLYRWRSRPSGRNGAGAFARVTAEHVWRGIQEGFSSEGDAVLDLEAELDSRQPPWALFVAALMAHGWFIKPKRFPLARPDEPQSAPVETMKRRINGFLLLWAAAFVVFPVRRVLGALAIYGAAITPGIRKINREFQKVDLDAEPSDLER